MCGGATAELVADVEKEISFKVEPYNFLAKYLCILRIARLLAPLMPVMVLRWCKV
jgi:hypothetical protein